MEAPFWKVVHVYHHGLSLPPDEDMIASKACGKKTSQIQLESFPKVESKRKPNQLTSTKILISEFDKVTNRAVSESK